MGDVLTAGVKKNAVEQELALSSFKAIVALSSARLGQLNRGTKTCQPSVVLNEQVELISLIGDNALQDGKRKIHATP